MRLIDADELKKRAEEICFPDMPDCGNFYAVGVPDIDIMPTIDPESLRPTAHWVSVKDRLPDPYEKVLVRLDHWAGVDTYLRNCRSKCHSLDVITKIAGRGRILCVIG